MPAALDKVSALDPVTIDDLILGCGSPGGEQGFNIGRVVAVHRGYNALPGTTVLRYCASSLQSAPRAFHTSGRAKAMRSFRRRGDRVPLRQGRG